MAKTYANYTIINVSDGAQGDPAWTYVTLTQGYDLNNCFAKDTVYVSTSTAICNSLLNKPAGFIAGEVRIETQWCGSNSYVIQNLYCRNGTNHKAFTRTKSGTSYSEWRELGAKGDPGANGNGISSITYYYATTTTQTEPSASSVTSTTIPSLSETNKYLWQKEVIAYTDGTSKTTVALIGVYGNKGEDGYTPQKGVDYFDGQDGTSVTVSSTEIKYQASSSGTTVPTGTWQNSPSASKGQYLWTRTTVNYSPSGSTTSYAVAYIGTDGQNGTSVTVSSTEVKYQESTSGTATPTGTWVNSPSATKGKYLWTRTVVTYSNGTSTTSYSVSYNGNDGQNGTSVTVSSTEVKYQESTNGTTAPTGTWNASPSATKGKYLWTRTVVTYSNGTSTTSYSVSYNGNDGQNGTSVSISSTNVTYATSTSGTTAPTSGWQTTVPSVSQGSFLWTKTVVTYSTGNSTTSYSVAREGNDGANGTSVTITSTSVTYAVSTSGTTAPSSGWQSSVPSVDKGKFLWTKTVVTYSNGTSTTSYSTSYQGTNGKDGEDGDDGIGIASIAYYYKVTTTQTAPSASDVTSTTIPTMSSTNRYLWQKEVINYTAGAPKTTVALIGVYGETGLNGTTFTPSVDANGNISWTNDGNKTNPTTQNIKGPKGDTGNSEGTFKGALSSAPSSKALNDYYVNTGDGITYEWNGSSWVQTTSAKKCLDGLNALIRGGHDLSTYGTRNTVTMFKSILAQEIYAETIKAVNGFFDNIEVGGTSKLLGNVDNFAFKTFTEADASSRITLDFLVNNNRFYQNYSVPLYYHRALDLSLFPLNFSPSRIALYNNAVESYPIDVISGSITVDGTTYTATASTPMCIVYNLSEFKVYYSSNNPSQYSLIASFTPYNADGYRTGEDNTKKWIATKSIFESPKDVSNNQQLYTAYTISACSLVINMDRLSGAYIRSLIPWQGASLGTASRRFSSAHVDDLSIRTAVAYEALIGQLGVSHDRHDAYVKDLNATSASITNIWGRLHGTADSANSVSWDGIPDKPEKFEPSNHDHDDRYYTESEVDAKLSGKGTYSKPNSGIPKTDLASAVQTSLGKADSALQSLPSHDHDSRYYTETEINTKLSGKADTNGSYSNMTVGNATSATSATDATYTRNIKNSSDLYTSCDNVVTSGEGVSCASKDGENAHVKLQQFGVTNPTKAYIEKVKRAFIADEASTASTATNADKLYLINKGNVRCDEVSNGQYAHLAGTDANGTAVPVKVGIADTATEATKASQIKINDTSSFSGLMAVTNITIGTDGILHYRGYDANGNVVDKGTATVYACFS